MKDNLAIEVKNLSKKFILDEARGYNSGKGIIQSLAKIFNNTGKYSNEFWALKDISFEVKRGEVLGIIGPNGVGKSTLLKILGQVVRPTAGRIELRGSVTSILDIGTGFHPDLTGRENVYFNGELLGLSRQEVKDRFNQIHGFSGIENFIDEPVKNYSNGMFLRLAFSVFAFLNPEILLLDEVFNVGDKEFQRKSAQKIKTMVKGGSTVILVSHNLEEIMEITDKCLLLEGGKVAMFDDTRPVIEFYMENILGKLIKKDSQSTQLNVEDNANDTPVQTVNKIVWTDKGKAPQNGVVRLQEIVVHALGKNPDQPIYMSEDICIDFIYEKIRSEGSVEWVVNIYDVTGSRLITDCAGFREDYKPANDPPGIYLDRVQIPGNLLNQGLFSIEITISKNFKELSGFTEAGIVLPFKIHLNAWDEERPWSKLINSSLRPKLQWTKKTVKLTEDN